MRWHCAKILRNIRNIKGPGYAGATWWMYPPLRPHRNRSNKGGYTHDMMCNKKSFSTSWRMSQTGRSETDRRGALRSSGLRSDGGSMSSDTSRNNNNNNLRSSARSKATTVPAFSIRSIQPGNRVQQPPRINVFAERPTPSLAFRRIYQRGDLPVCIVHESRLFRLGWKVS